MFKTRLRTTVFASAAFSLTMPASNPAHACTGSGNDPTLCINNNQAINGFSSFYFNNLQDPCSGGSCSSSGEFFYGPNTGGGGIPRPYIPGSMRWSQLFGQSDGVAKVYSVV